MDDKAGDDSFWVEEIDGKAQNPIRKRRKHRKQKKEFDGWGSTLLIGFLRSIGRDTSNELTQSEVTDIVNEYVKQNNLISAMKKKRVVCDQRLHLLFGRKTIGRLKINDLLESHFAENRDKSDDDIFFNSDDEEDAVGTSQTPKSASSERKSQPKKLAREKQKSCFAAFIPFNIKLVYLRRSLVEELLKNHETFETKVIGGFIRIKCDPNDYLQKNSHQLLQVTGVKKGSGISTGILLEVSGFFKDVSINMLSDDNFSEEECKNLHQRVKDGLLKKPMIWLARELTMLQNLIDRANEKGWRRELYEYLQKREKLQNPVEQERLLREIPQAIAEDLESESPTPDVPEDGELESPTPYVSDKRVENNSQELRKSTRKQASLVTEVPKAVEGGFLRKATKPDVPEDLELESQTPVLPDKRVENNLQELWKTTSKKAYLVSESPKAIADDFLLKATKLDIADLVIKEEKNSPKSTSGLRGASKVPPFNMEMNSTVLNVISRGTAAVHQSPIMPLQQEPMQHIDLNDDASNADKSNETKISKGSEHRSVKPSQSNVIELSDDDEGEKPKTTIQVPAEVLESLNWYYRDPQGAVQGPFSLTSLKRWSDGNYFPPNFMVWKAGQSQFESELLVTILHQFFPS
ncbi:PREDICTED: uncharacterized protein At5g08430-like isoform X2 [Lupinus angustifolius]|uniref:uncharacterized protein At5g08430-like isoform X2 n=1 Tax=Lupinus angustifolius TaxID=3871 RepID=UPI00092F2760|nr:PREDICTED: uncharacterized protein At5g08430-like isoform X2 [Lupinus angustifolius]